MCCRYWIERSPEMDPIIDEVNKSPLNARWLQWTGIKTEGEIRPADVVPVIAPSPKGGRKVYPMKWGFSGRSLLMNARVETAATKPTFMDAWKSN